MSPAARHAICRALPLLMLAVAACGDSAATEEAAGPPAAERVSAVIVSPQLDTLDAIDRTAPLQVEVRNQAGVAMSGQAVQWSSSRTDVVSVAANGVVTARAAGIAVITAVRDGVSGTATVIVRQAPARVTVSPATWNPAALGATQQLTAQVSDANGHAIAGAVVAWSSSDPGVITVAEDGLATALRSGTATLTAAIDGTSSTIAASVQQAVSRVVVSPPSWSPTALGVQQQFAAVAHDANGHVIASAAVAWSSSDATIAEVTPSGMVTARGNGKARLVASVAAASGGSDVEVKQVLSRVTITPADDTLHSKGDTRTLTATGVDVNGSPVSGLTFTWRSSDASIVSVSAGGVVSAVAPGSVEITAVSSNVQGLATMTVPQPPPMQILAIRVDPDVWSADAGGQRQQFRVIGRTSDGEEHPLTGATWASSATTVATTDQQGIAQSGADGQATLTAKLGTMSATASITVDRTLGPGDGTVWSVWLPRQVLGTAVLMGGRLYTKDPKVFWNEQPYTPGNIAKFQFEGDRYAVLTDVVGGQGTLRVHDRVGEWVDVLQGTVKDFQLEGNRIGAHDASDALRIKEGTFGAWTTVTTDVRKFQLEGNRIAVLRTDGEFRVKDGINSAWTILAAAGTDVVDFALTGSRIGTLTGAGELRVKDGIHGAWTVVVASGATEFQLEANAIAVIVGGELRAKSSLGGQWNILATGGVQKFQLEESRVGVLGTDGSFRGQATLGGALIDIATGVTDFSLSGDHTAIIEGGTLLRVKSGALGGPWRFSRTVASVDQLEAAVPVNEEPFRTSVSRYNSLHAACVLEHCIRDWERDLPVPNYGRNCGMGRATSDNTQSIDGLDYLCYHHDSVDSWYSTSTGSWDTNLSGACILRFGIKYGRMTKDGVTLQPGTSAYNTAWGRMPETRSAVNRYTTIVNNNCWDDTLADFEKNTRVRP